jgi:MFS family permease
VAYRQFNLLRTRRFGPLFATQFLGAFNDNLYKNALVILITYRLGATTGVSPELLVTAAAGIFILPFFVFSGVAGELADRYDKAMLIRWTKIAEVLIMAAGVIGFALGDVWFLMGVLLLMGTQSAFFGPLKYGILPDHLAEDELVGGNALIEAATFLAILAGTIIGGLFVLKYGGIVMVSAMTVMVAVIGYGASRKIPSARAGDPSLEIHWNPLTATTRVLVHVAHTRAVFAAVLGIAWFWFLGSAYMAQFPNLAKGVLAADESVVSLFLMVFAAGIGAGSLLAGILLHGQISARFVPWAGAAMALFSLDLLQVEMVSSATLRDIPAFLASIAGWRLLADLFGLSLAAGLYVVPLYAILQTRSDPAHRARAIAGLNITDAAFMVASSILGLAALASGVSVPTFLALSGAASLPAALLVTWGVKPSARRQAG